jgi:hypothetical protein
MGAEYSCGSLELHKMHSVSVICIPFGPIHWNRALFCQITLSLVNKRYER